MPPMHVSQSAPHPEHIAADVPLLRDPRFMRFALANLLRNLGMNALVYGLFILIVGDENAGIATAAFVLTSTVPSILFGFLGGVTADAFPRKATMLVSLAVQAAVIAYLLRVDPSIPMIIILTAVIWTAGQFYSPAESAALGAVAYPERAARASALSNAVSLAAQVAGAGLIAPLALKAFGARGLFAISLVLVVAAAGFFGATAHLTPPRVRRGKRRLPGWRALTEGWRTIREHDELSRAISFFVLLDCAFVVAIVAAPSFITDVLGTSADNAVYIFAPGALGIVVGLIVTPLLLRALPARLLVTVGFALFVGVMLTLPFVVEIAAQLDQRFLPLRDAQRWLRVPREIAATALLLPFAGLGVTFVRVSAKTAILRHAPTDRMAQVFATETTLDSAATLLPTVAAGALLAVIDVRAVLIIAGSITAIAAILTVAGPLRFAPSSHEAESLAHSTPA